MRTPLVISMCERPPRGRLVLRNEQWTGGTTMIDWNSENWGNRVTCAANGSWVADKHDEDDAEQD